MLLMLRCVSCLAVFGVVVVCGRLFAVVVVDIGRFVGVICVVVMVVVVVDVVFVV